MADGARIGLTGHRGFVGRRLLPFLQSKGYETVVFDGDLLDCNAVANFFSENTELTALVHLAGSFFGTDSEILRKNAVASANLAGLLRSQPQLRVIFASSGAVYGNTGDIAAKESRDLVPNTVYGLAKKWAEEVFDFYLGPLGGNLVALRLPSLYGPGNDKGVIHSWMKSIREDASITLHGEGDQARSFLHVDDLVEGIGRFILDSSTGRFNFAEKESFSLKELISCFRSNAEFTVTNLPEQNVLQSMVIDSAKLYETLSWSPTRSVKTYIDDQSW